MSEYWAAAAEWPGETVYIIGGGPSVKTQNLAMLRGRRVIVINSSYEAYPEADFLFFGDARWWLEHCGRPAMRAFEGRVVTCANKVSDPRLLKMRRVVPPPGLAEARDSVASQRTSLQGAINLAVHLGAQRLVLLGADMCRSADGATHHHAPHKWPNPPGNASWDVQMSQLRLVVDPLRRRGVEVINTSPVSRLTWWPRRLLAECVS